MGFHRAFTGRGETEQTINKGLIAKKVLDDTCPTERQKHGVGDHSYAGAGIAKDCCYSRPLTTWQQT